jgi:hypothetical protein
MIPISPIRPMIPISPIRPMIPISPIRPMIPILPIRRSVSSSLHSRPIHLLLEPSVLQELLLHPLNEALEEHVLLVNERDGDVGDGLGAAAAYLLAVDSRVEVCAAEGARLAAARVVESPLLQTARAQIVLVVEKQLMQARAVDIGKTYHHLRRRYPINITFGKVLFTGPRRLNHLVNRTVTNSEKLMGKVKRDVVDALRLLESLQRMVVATLVNEFCAHSGFDLGCCKYNTLFP